MWSWQKLHVYKQCGRNDQLPAAATAEPVELCCKKKVNFPQYYAETQYDFCSNPFHQTSQRSRMPSLKNLRPRMLCSYRNISESSCNISHTFSLRSVARPLHFCPNPPTHDENSKWCFFAGLGQGSAPLHICVMTDAMWRRSKTLQNVLIHPAFFEVAVWNHFTLN